MKKEEIRKEYFKLKIKGNSYAVCIRILKAQFGFEVSERTLQRWSKRLNESEWDLVDKSTRPKNIRRKITSDIEAEVIKIRKETGWGERKIVNYCKVSHSSAYRILRKNNLTKQIENRRKRIKYIRWQRKHPNSLWQMDVSDQKIEGKYCFAVIDDCSRYCLGAIALNNITTKILTNILDGLIETHGKPREILTDNGSVFGLRSKHSQFDRWCNRRGIKHIRTAIHSPTTTGKIERFFQTLDNEMKFCRDAEHFRMRYNHFRPHTSLENNSPSNIYFAFDKLF
jgi:transposase InsO family protein